MRSIRHAVPLLVFAAGVTFGLPLHAADTPPESPPARAVAGDAGAEVAWGKHLLDSKDPATKASSTEWFRRAAGQGDGEGQWMLGSAYMAGIGVPRDSSVALDWMRKSVTQGTPDHMATYGLTLIMTGSFEGKSNDGLDWLHRSVEAGSATGMIGLGMLQLSGMSGVAKDPAAAEALFRKAADGGSAEAQAALGQLYLTNMFGKQNIPEAMRLLNLAARQGRPDAQGTLGYFLISGEHDVPKDPAQGVEWAGKAAAQNAAPGYYALGTAYLLGSGKPKDPAQAWYNFAVASRLDAKHQLGKVADRMSDAATQLKPGQIEQLRAQVEKVPLPAAP